MRLSKSLWNLQRKSIHILHISGCWKENYLHSKECIHQLLVKQHLSIHIFLLKWSSKIVVIQQWELQSPISFPLISYVEKQSQSNYLFHLFIYFANKLCDYINSFLPSPTLHSTLLCANHLWNNQKTVTVYLTSGASTNLFQSLKHLQHLCFEYVIYGLFGAALVTWQILEDKHWINPEVILLARRTIPQPFL